MLQGLGISNYLLSCLVCLGFWQLICLKFDKNKLNSFLRFLDFTPRIASLEGSMQNCLSTLWYIHLQSYNWEKKYSVLSSKK